MQHAINEFRKNIGQISNAISVKKPSQMPNLAPISKSCPRNAIFGYFIPTHRKAAEDLKNILLGMSMSGFLEIYKS